MTAERCPEGRPSEAAASIAPRVERDLIVPSCSVTISVQRLEHQWLCCIAVVSAPEFGDNLTACRRMV